MTLIIEKEINRKTRNPVRKVRSRWQDKTWNRDKEAKKCEQGRNIEKENTGVREELRHKESKGDCQRVDGQRTI